MINQNMRGDRPDRPSPQGDGNNLDLRPQRNLRNIQNGHGRNEELMQSQLIGMRGMFPVVNPLNLLSNEIGAQENEDSNCSNGPR